MPFGMEISRSVFGTKNEYLYNKKELQENLGVYDYGARFYDPVVARWGVLDRFASKYFSNSPYSYVLDNPVKNLDINGDSVNVSNLLKQGVEGLYAFVKMRNDLQDITGQELAVNSSGNLVAQNPTNKGSAKARTYLNTLLGSSRTVTVGVDNSMGTNGTGSNRINLNTDQIDGNIAQTTLNKMPELTNGYGISFLHETLHTGAGTLAFNPSATNVYGDPPNTQPGAIGPTETIINTFRNELGLPERNQYFWQQPAGSTSAPTMEWKDKNGNIITISKGIMETREQILRRAKAVILNQ